MAFMAKILADSAHPYTPSRLTTMELTYPRIIHSEFMTHRQFSRNAASSRAIPIEKMLKRIQEDPFIPIVWGTNKPGMVAGAAHEDSVRCEEVWLDARNEAVAHARTLNSMGIHKQTVNRIIEPWMWITVIATAVDHGWENFFKLRCAPDAEPHIQRIAYMARDVMDAATPKTLKMEEHHLPLIGFPGDEALARSELRPVSVARCARVSYLTHDGQRDIAADIGLFERLKNSGHWSPFEHVAAPADFMYRNRWPQDRKVSNFGQEWVQYRKEFQDEYCRKAPR